LIRETEASVDNFTLSSKQNGLFQVLKTARKQREFSISLQLTGQKVISNPALISRRNQSIETDKIAD